MHLGTDEDDELSVVGINRRDGRDGGRLRRRGHSAAPSLALSVDLDARAARWSGRALSGVVLRAPSDEKRRPADR